MDDRLVTVKDPVVLTYSEEELRALQAGITDPNFRIFADRDGITVLNNERFVRGTDGPHSATSSRSSAWTKRRTRSTWARSSREPASPSTLGKTYRQDEALSWGYLTPPDEARSRNTCG